MSRLLFISHSGDKTGAPVVFSRLFKWVVKEAKEDAYLLFRYNGLLAKECAKEFGDDRVSIIRKSNPRSIFRPLKPLSKFYDFLLLVKLFGRIKAPVIIVNSLINTTAIIAGLLVGSKVIVWAHELPGAINDPLKIRSFWLRRAHIGLGDSEESCDYLKKIGLSPARTFLVHHGLDLTSIKSKGREDPRERGKDPLRLGALAIWSPNKRLDQIIETAIKVAEYSKNNHIRLDVCGTVDSDFPKLFDQIKKQYLTTPSNLEIRFLGQIEDIQDFYNQIDALLVTSEKESLPTVVLEAMAFQLPIFSFRDLPGVQEILGINTFLAKTRTSSALAAEVVNFFYCSPQPFALEEWRQYARIRVQRFSLEKQWQAIRVIIAGAGYWSP
jgi:glycosyltransferase involved in cell wall biosynthesis